MSVLESLFIGVFGMAVVFIVLVGLSLLVRLQSGLVNRFVKKKPDERLIGDVSAADASNIASPEAEVPLRRINENDSSTQHSEDVQRNAGGNGGNAGETSGGSGETTTKYTMMINGIMYKSEVEEVNISRPPINAVTPPAPVAPPASITPPAPIMKPAPIEASGRAASAGPGEIRREVITAPVPGTVIQVRTAAGAKVKRGDILLLLEAMKMENEIVATRDGTIAQVLTSSGAIVITGTPLIAMQ